MDDSEQDRQYTRPRDDRTYRFLARDEVGDLEVVTARLGMDQGDHDQPWMFDTVTLGLDGRLLGDEELFASTEEEATANTRPC